MTFFSRASFTLIELLIVIAIVAVLSVVVLVTLNPVELLNQSRDSNRISDLDTLNRALNLFIFALPSGSLGDATKIYVSTPDPNLATATGTCTVAMGFSAPPGYTYVCASSSTFTRVDGRGWIPVDFTKMIGITSPISRLPTDPVNNTSSGFYYTYVPGGSWAITATLQSQKYLQQSAGRDGGVDVGRLEAGTDLSLVAKSQGLVGYWKLDEGSGSTAVDSSGNGNNGILVGSPPWTTGKIGGALSFNGSSQYVQVPVLANTSIDKISQTLTPTSTHSIVGWIQIQSYHPTLLAGVVGRGRQGGNGFGLNLTVDATRLIELGRHGSNPVDSATHPPGSPPAGVYHVAGVYDGINGKIYVNGVLEGTASFSPPVYPVDDVNNLHLGRTCSGSSGCSTYSYFNGLLDEMKLYNRALTASEILADYNATK